MDAHADPPGLCTHEPDVAFEPSNPYFALHLASWIVTILVSITASLLSLRLIGKHLKNYRSPLLQRHAVRLLLMVPLFALLSSLSFRLLGAASYLDVVRDAYEAIALWSFHALLSLLLGPDEETRRAKLAGQADRPWPFPLNFMHYNPRGKAFLVNIRMLLLQYPVARTAITVLALVLNSFGLFCEESFSPLRFKFWFVLTNFLSSTIALYALFIFYQVTADLLTAYSPLYKFLALKIVVFLAYWQSLVLSFLSSTGLLPLLGYSRLATTERSISSFLICLEMLLAGWMHHRAFPITDFCTPGPETPFWSSLLHALDPTDLWTDLKTAPDAVRELANYRAAKRAYKEIRDIDAAFDDDGIRTPGANGSFDGIDGYEYEIEEGKPDVVKSASVR